MTTAMFPKKAKTDVVGLRNLLVMCCTNDLVNAIRTVILRVDLHEQTKEHVLKVIVKIKFQYHW